MSHASHEQPEEQSREEPATRKVVIEVLGGVAYVASCPEDVAVEIIDYDNTNEETSALEDFLERADMPQEGE